jgi:phosphoesterase RecJ-like protein
VTIHPLNQTLNRASRLIRVSQRPILICHVAPDGDSIGSLIGLGHSLANVGKSPILACSDPVPPDLAFIPEADSVVRGVPDEYDLVISVDCSDLHRMGSYPHLSGFSDRRLVNIDHHPTNVMFGDVNVVDSSATSTAEVIVRLLDKMAIPIDDVAATCLLTGIVTDTRGFRTSNVTVDAMELAVRLMKAGASLPDITRNGLDRRPTSAIRLWGEALAALQVEDGIIWTSINAEARGNGVGHVGNGDAGLANFLLSSTDAVVSAVFADRGDGNIEVGLRALVGYDVSRVALSFGGGGHLLAAGCSVTGSLKEVEADVLAALRADLKRQAESGDRRRSESE